MSSKLVRALAVIAVLAVSAAVVLRATGGADAARTALQTVPGTAGAAFTDVPARDSVVVPPKPKRQIVEGVEVVVNIPSGRLELLQGDSLVKSYPVSVGSARYSTPVGDYLLATVIWNPWWNPPPGSAWAAKRRRTPPGPGNPMGRVKLHMDELIYIHGTTSEGRLGAPASHGCIRMSNSDVVDLARRLNLIANPSMSEAELDRLARNDRRTRETVLARSVRMRVTYRVARVRGEKLHVYPDVYGRAGDFASAVRAELARAGADPSEVDAVAMRYLRDRAYSRGGASFALADLSTLRPPVPKVQLAEIAPVVVPAVAEAPRPDSIAAPIAEATDTVAAAVPQP
ncbi:MAG TPA: L,D-transpeptidase [Longimicrobium sp.]|jgi:lipoprotein-anchoring transpeptidase ErfK/SrfK